jgi:hypothetical protein
LNSAEENMKTKNRFLGALLFFILASFVILSAPQQDAECQNLYPDEASDLFGIAEISGVLYPSSNIFHQFVAFLSNNLYSERFTSELGLSVTLRC